MIITLPLSDKITCENLDKIKCDAYEIREFTNIEVLQKVSKISKPLISHSSVGITKSDFILSFFCLPKSISFRQMSFHFGPACYKYIIKDDKYVTDGKILNQKEIEQKTCENICKVKKMFKGEIALENTNRYPGPEYNYVCNPKFITKVFGNYDINMVLDIAHAFVSAENMKIPFSDYINSLPLNRVTEIHLSKPAYDSDWECWRDMHNIPNDYEYNILRRVLKILPNNPYVVVEYYKDFYGVVECYERLNKIKGKK